MPVANEPLKLNLGCGHRKLAGYLNVDKSGTPDARVDLEQIPWPWPDSSANEIVLQHVLEHLGSTSQAYLQIIREMYRVCMDGAIVKIAVPHPRHENFIGDPTHVRAITPQSLSLFSRRANEESVAKGFAASTLALDCGVDFEIRSAQAIPDERIRQQINSGKITIQDVQDLALRENNVIVEYRIEWVARKLKT